MTRPEKFSRYKTTAWGANKVGPGFPWAQQLLLVGMTAPPPPPRLQTVEKILADGRTRNPGDPFNPIHVDGDLTKVSADAPAWFNIPEVTVMDKTKPQQKVLTQWGAMQDEPYWLTSAEVGELVRP